MPNIKIDLHGCTLQEAINNVLDELKTCESTSAITIEIVHGFHQGQRLRKYIRSKQFRMDMKNEGHELTMLPIDQEGRTLFTFHNPPIPQQTNEIKLKSEENQKPEKEILEDVRKQAQEKLEKGKKVVWYEAQELFK